MREAHRNLLVISPTAVLFDAIGDGQVLKNLTLDGLFDIMLLRQTAFLAVSWCLQAKFLEI
jgi:hypothetical protein